MQLRSLGIAAWLIALMIAGVLGLEVRPGLAQPAPVIIDNGTVQMGINPEGHLDVPGGTPALQNGTTNVGLRYIPTNGESTAPGCLCEGWGVANADGDSGSFAGYANIATDGGVVGLVVEAGTGVTATDQTKAESVGSAFKSIVTTTNGRLKVTHDYHPSSSPNLYQVDVTIENIHTTSTIGDLRYRRVMDWDIAPFTFSEFVEIHVGTAANLVLATTDGFRSANPLASPGPGVGSPPTTLESGDGDYFSGPSDQGALFDFAFGALAPGASVTFTIYYGAAANRTDALAAISSVEAEIYSLGLPKTGTDEAAVNGPHAFIFAFGGVGGTPVPPPVFEPTITTAVSGLNFPFGVAAGSIYIADRNNHVVKKFDGETLTIVAGCSVNASGNCVTPPSGTGDAGYNGDGIAATAAQLNSPTGVAVANGTLFIADSGNHTIRSVNLTTGIISTVAGIPQKLGPAVNGGLATEAALFGPRAVAAVADEVGTIIYIADTMNQQVRMVDLATGIITAVAGVAGETGNNNGPVATARLNNPLGVAVANGIVYIADEGNDSIRIVDDGSVSTLNVGALDSPSGVAVDLNGVLYIADTDNHRVQRFDGETVTTVAGGNGAGDSGDGGPAAAAQLNTPVAVAVDSTGQFLYIADLINNRIRKVDLGISQ
jgi:hypothetical protein